MFLDSKILKIFQKNLQKIYNKKYHNKNMTLKRNFWDYLAWICLAGITIWVILKILGIINTPIWLEYAPIYGAIYLAGWNVNKLERATKDIKENSKDIKEIKFDISNIKFEIQTMKTKCSKIN